MATYAGETDGWGREWMWTAWVELKESLGTRGHLREGGLQDVSNLQERSVQISERKEKDMWHPLLSLIKISPRYLTPLI